MSVFLSGFINPQRGLILLDNRWTLGDVSPEVPDPACGVLVGAPICLIGVGRKPDRLHFMQDLQAMGPSGLPLG
ncbi:hypothetical protein CEW88_07405 [Alloyangia pacifica]|uniref:Uncharacterized protein n=1 Tax=Alloyangia pacifica TaxID=311180 RepID=A0A2U8HCL7_9RHOB|nr:hypothetical protein CEW88_07405 [Alloyangia pacifica]